MACKTNINEYTTFNFKAVTEDGEMIKISRLAKTVEDAMKSAKIICNVFEWKFAGFFDHGDKCDRILCSDNSLCRV